MAYTPEEAFRQGRFRDADRLLRASSSNTVEDAVLRLELDYFLGHAAEVQKNGHVRFSKILA